VALVRISDACLKPAARDSLKTQDAKKSPKIAIWRPSHNFVGQFVAVFHIITFTMLLLTTEVQQKMQIRPN